MELTLACKNFRKIRAEHLNFGNCPASPYGANNVYLTKGGKPFIPVAGEFHFSRCDKRFWKEELLKMKAGGINTVATYVFWLMHEEEKGAYNFAGNRDLNAFVRVCQECGMPVILRIGPWCHGEMRHGGFPRYVQKMKGKRTNNPTYLAAVKKLYARYREEVKEFLDGETVIAVQLENEFGGNVEHLFTLKQLAREAGFVVPYFTVTAWPPKDTRYEFLPLRGGYPEAPWTWHKRPLAPRNRFAVSGEINMEEIGADVIEKQRYAERTGYDYPFATCETGPGNQVTAHRRPIISKEDAYGIAFAHVASGCNMLGYYMFHGGSNPEGGLYQESRLTLYPNNYQIIDYDFQAPLSRYGYSRDSFRLLKNLNYFLNSFGEEFARMQPFCNPLKKDVYDVDTPKCSVRMNEAGAGFFFISSYERGLKTKAFSALSVTLDTPQGTVKLPTLDVKAGSMFFYPFQMEIGGRRFDYITAKPICKTVAADKETWYLEEIDGVAAELSEKGQVSRLINQKWKQADKEYAIVLLSAAEAARFYMVGGRVFYTEATVIGGDSPVRICKQETSTAGVTLTLCKKTKLPYNHYLYARGKRRYYALSVPKNMLENCYDAVLDFSFAGNSLQMFAGGKLVNDYFNVDGTCTVSLKYYKEQIEKGGGFLIKTAPFTQGKKIYTEFPHAFGDASLTLKNVTVYQTAQTEE